VDVPGLSILLDVVPHDVEVEIDRLIGRPPKPDGERDRNRVFRYGPRVHATGYSSGEITDDIPDVLAKLAKLVGVESNAITLNEYMPGQGICWHFDNPRAGQVIVSIGLLGDAVLGMRKGKKAPTSLSFQFPRRALVRFEGESRHAWQHTIFPVTERRLSVVLRNA
jgi:alkylated DNA repair dioxygenase AlkB